MAKNPDDKGNRALSEIKKDEGEAVSIAVILKAIENVANYFNVGKNLDAKQILDIAVLTASEYYFLTENELQLLVNRIKLNKYGEKVKVLDSIDGRIWFQYLAEFQMEKSIQRQKIEDEERQKRFLEWEQAQKLDPPKPETLEKVKAMLKFSPAKTSSFVFKQYTSEQEEEYKKQLDEIRAEFEEIFKTYGKRAGGMRFVPYADNMLNFQAYAKQRFQEIYKPNEEENEND